MNLIQKLFNESLDIIGDIHGEYDALVKLIESLGYDLEGYHPENRKLVFVGDLCDRGPDSPAVINLIKKLIDNGNAQAIIGNHELNILQKAAKDGGGWFFEERRLKDKAYEPFNRVDGEDKENIYNFLSTLPIALENEDLRIVHAAWDNESISKITKMDVSNVGETYLNLEKEIDLQIEESGLLKRYKDEQSIWHKEMEEPTASLPYLNATSEYNLAHQMNNPIRVLTSGVEQKCETPFYASGRWRFVERCTWWNNYTDSKPVVVGHFWRKLNPVVHTFIGENVFENIAPESWHGKNRNVFCIDFSVGARFKERNMKEKIGENTHLVALRWPERVLMLENGDVINTTSFKNEGKKIKF